MIRRAAWAADSPCRMVSHTGDSARAVVAIVSNEAIATTQRATHVIGRKTHLIRSDHTTAVVGLTQVVCQLVGVTCLGIWTSAEPISVDIRPQLSCCEVTAVLSGPRRMSGQYFVPVVQGVAADDSGEHEWIAFDELFRGVA